MNMNKIQQSYYKMYSAYGPQEWWPVSSKQNAEFEIIIGAILTQGTSWKNVEICIKNLIKNNLINIKKLNKIKNNELSKLIKPSGYYNQKTIKIKNFTDYVIKNYNGNLRKLSAKNIKNIRNELLNINGIGKETADSIILYAFNKPVFVIDAYTRRIFERLFNLNFKTYDEWQNYFHKNLPRDAKLFNEYHALIVEHGKNICKKKPLCDECVIKNNCNHFSKNKNK